MAAPETILIRHEDFEFARFRHVGRYESGQFLAYVTYAAPKQYWTEAEDADGNILWRQHMNCFAVLHRFDEAGQHHRTDVERVTSSATTEAEEWPELEKLLARLAGVEFRDIRVKPFQVEVEGTLHGLIYERERFEENEDEQEWVMLMPNDVMFHPPWDSGEYSS